MIKPKCKPFWDIDGGFSTIFCSVKIVSYHPLLELICQPISCLLILTGWNTLVYAERNMEWLTEHCRTGEQEEVMTYLSRKPGTSSAYVEWRFDLTEAGAWADILLKMSLKFSPPLMICQANFN
jgi:hypothetical protein